MRRIIILGKKRRIVWILLLSVCCLGYYMIVNVLIVLTINNKQTTLVVTTALNKESSAVVPNKHNQHASAAAAATAWYTATEVLQEPFSRHSCQTQSGMSSFSSSSRKMQDPSSSATIVTAYFRLPSKHTPETYERWMKLFLGLHDNMIIFTETALVETIRTLRSHAWNRTVIVACRNGVNDLPIRKLGQSKLKKQRPNINDDNNNEFWKHQLEMDPEQKAHQNYKLFWIWLSKSWFVTQAMALNPFQSQLFVYSDIGCFRHAMMYRNVTLIRYPQHVPTDRILWMAHHTPNPPPTLFWNNKLLQPHYYFHSGSQGAGWAATWPVFHRRFAATIDAFVTRYLFVGEDQCVLQSTCQQYPDLCAYIPFDQVYDNHYFGLRYVLHFAGNHTYWYMPPNGKGKSLP